MKKVKGENEKMQKEITLMKSTIEANKIEIKEKDIQISMNKDIREKMTKEHEVKISKL